MLPDSPILLILIGIVLGMYVLPAIRARVGF